MAEITLTRGKVALVDDGDVPLLSKFRWSAESYRAGKWRTSAIVGHGTKRMFMHRMILQAPKGLEVDHINGDGLDNRRCNLRLATRSQNACNVPPKPRSATGLRGVHKLVKHDKYDAAIQVNGRYIYLGIFTDKYEAAKAYNAAALKYHGEFATLNGGV